jgi:peptidoglycan L-alanyl-D-glutamate endopeptidase CwlK
MTIEARIDELMTASRPQLADLFPYFADKVSELIGEAARQGLFFGCFMGYRSYDTQRALYAQGRQPLGAVNALRYHVGLPAIDEGASKKKVTNAMQGESWHNYGLAADLVEDGDPSKAGIQWSWRSIPDYIRLGKIASGCGLESGSLWRCFVDYPHVQMTAGLTLAQVKILYSVGGLEAVWTEVAKRIRA